MLTGTCDVVAVADSRAARLGPEPITPPSAYLHHPQPAPIVTHAKFQNILNDIKGAVEMIVVESNTKEVTRAEKRQFVDVVSDRPALPRFDPRESVPACPSVRAAEERTIRSLE